MTVRIRDLLHLLDSHMVSGLLHRLSGGLDNLERGAVDGGVLDREDL